MLQAFGLHGHSHHGEDDHDHDHGHDEEESDEYAYLWKASIVLLGIYLFYLMEVAMHGFSHLLTVQNSNCIYNTFKHTATFQNCFNHNLPAKCLANFSKTIQ